MFQLSSSFEIVFEIPKNSLRTGYHDNLIKTVNYFFKKAFFLNHLVNFNHTK